MFEITLNGPAKNALGTEMMRWIMARLDEAGGQPVLLTGAGDALSAGLNLREVAGLDAAGMLEFLRTLERVMSALYLYPGPTVAAVNGHAIAGGCVLVECCDFRISAPSPKIKIGLNEVALGLRFPPRILSIVRRRLPPTSIEEVLLGAGLFDPATSLRLGLLDAIEGDPVAAARAKLAALAAHPADAYALTKADLRGTLAGLCPDDRHEAELADAVGRWTSDALKQKIASLLAR